MLITGGDVLKGLLEVKKVVDDEVVVLSEHLVHMQFSRRHVTEWLDWNVAACMQSGGGDGGQQNDGQFPAYKWDTSMIKPCERLETNNVMS